MKNYLIILALILLISCKTQTLQYTTGATVCYLGKKCTITYINHLISFYELSYVDNLGKIQTVAVFFDHSNLITTNCI